MADRTKSDLLARLGIAHALSRIAGVEFHQDLPSGLVAGGVVLGAWMTNDYRLGDRVPAPRSPRRPLAAVHFCGDPVGAAHELVIAFREATAGLDPASVLAFPLPVPSDADGAYVTVDRLPARLVVSYSRLHAAYLVTLDCLA